jgi:predicted NUDIX family NTP pyrophosphohydrolase
MEQAAMTRSYTHNRTDRMAKPSSISAGILVWRRHRGVREYLLAHPGGPYWARKDDGAWTIPKGLVEPGHGLLPTAQREFLEETGLTVSGDFVTLEPVTSSGRKLVHAFAIEADLDLEKFASNTFEMEWPPRSGRKQHFPEVDRIGYFNGDDARTKIVGYQRPLIEQAERQFK